MFRRPDATLSGVAFVQQASRLRDRRSASQYRRRSPGASCVIRITLGTADRETAVRLSARLSAAFEIMPERLLRPDRLIPDALIAR